MELRPQTLIVAIQCIASQTRALDQKLVDMDRKDAAETEDLLVTFDLAAAELKKAYLTVLETHKDLPPYERLANVQL